MPGLNIIITGSTGFVGFSVVHWAMYHPHINRIFVLTRRPMPAHVVNDRKVTVIIHQNFGLWPPHVLGLLATAHACIWALGGHAFSFGSLDDAEETTMDFPRRAAEIFAQAAGPHLPPNRPFTFVFVSIRSAEWDDSKPLLYLKNTRRLKGRAEVELLRTEEASPENLEIKIARPGFLVTGIKSGLKGPLKAIGRRLPGGMVDVERLSHCLLRIALGDFPDHAIFEAEFLNEHGKQDYGQRPNAFIRLGRNIRDRIMRHHHQ